MLSNSQESVSRYVDTINRARHLRFLQSASPPKKRKKKKEKKKKKQCSCANIPPRRGLIFAHRYAHVYVRGVPPGACVRSLVKIGARS